MLGVLVNTLAVIVGGCIGLLCKKGIPERFSAAVMSKVGVIDTFPSGSAAEAVIVKIAGLLSTHGVVPALLAGGILADILASTMPNAAANCGGNPLSIRKMSCVSSWKSG